MKFRLILTVLLLIVFQALKGQKYGTAIGIRAGNDELGLTLQQRIFPNWTLEGILSFQQDGWRSIVLGEYHRPLFGKSLNYYLGPGFHIGQCCNDETFIGAGAILGIEWKIPAFPFAISYDIQPTLNFGISNKSEFRTAISVRYILISQSDLKKRARRKKREKLKEDVKDIFNSDQ